MSFWALSNLEQLGYV